jgi:hypothetical protein
MELNKDDIVMWDTQYDGMWPHGEDSKVGIGIVNKFCPLDKQNILIYVSVKPGISIAFDRGELTKL